MILLVPLALAGWGAHEYLMLLRRLLPFIGVALALLGWAALRRPRPRPHPGETGNDLAALGFDGEADTR